jgi:hypothetical protein
MNVHFNKALGNHCQTLHSHITPPPSEIVSKEQIVMVSNLSVGEEVHVVYPDALVEQIRMTAQSMLSLNPHPVDQTIVGIDAEVVKQIQILMIRTEGKQRRLDADTVAAEASQELAISRELVKRLSPLATRISKNKCSAEEVMQSIHAEEDSDRARKTLVGLIKTPSPLLVGNKLLASPQDESTSGSIWVQGGSSHQLKLQIGLINHEDASMTAKLLACEAPSSLFKGRQVGSQVIRLKVPKPQNFFLMGQCASMGWPISLNLSIDTSLSARSTGYSATVISIIDREDLASRLKDAVAAKTMSLFEAQSE